MALRTAERAAVATGVPARPGRAAWWEVVPPLVLTVLGLTSLRRGHGFWFDEAFTAEMVRLPLDDLFWAFVRGEGPIPYLRDAPPSYNAPYYAFAHVWLLVTALGADEVGLRLLSLVAAVGAVAVFTRAVARLARSAGVGVVAGLFMAANPFVVQYAVEARGYALALLATSVAGLGLARWLESGGRGDVVVYGAAAAAAALFHWYALLVPLAFAAAAVVLRGWRRAAPVLAATAVAAVPAACVAATAVANGVGTSGAEWLRGVGAQVPWLVLRAWSGRSVALLVATVVTVLLAARRTGGGGEGRLVAGLWVAVPVVVVAVAEAVRPVFVDRYLLVAMVALAVLMAMGATRFRPAVSAVVVAGVLGASLAATTSELRRPPKDDVKAAVAMLAAAHEPGQPVVAGGRFVALGVDHYVGDDAGMRAALVLPWAPVPPSSTTVWVVRRVAGGVKGDDDRLAAVESELAGLGLGVAEERRFEGRYADVLVQRWTTAQASVRTD
jgi:mannosyltransferase